jgi:hypothetical protein
MNLFINIIGESSWQMAKPKSGSFLQSYLRNSLPDNFPEGQVLLLKSFFRARPPPID